MVPLNIEDLNLNKSDSLGAIDQAYSEAVNSNPKYFYFESGFSYSYYESGLIVMLYLNINYDFLSRNWDV